MCTALGSTRPDAGQSPGAAKAFVLFFFIFSVA
jgi:hypothetical protein